MNKIMDEAYDYLKTWFLTIIDGQMKKVLKRRFKGNMMWILLTHRYKSKCLNLESRQDQHKCSWCYSF